MPYFIKSDELINENIVLKRGREREGILNIRESFKGEIKYDVMVTP